MKKQFYSKLISKVVAGTALAGFLLFGGAQQASASTCEQRVDRADHRLHEAIEHRGYESRESEHARNELREAREQCWNSDRRWWDADQNRWRTDRDWNDNDHRDYGHR